MLNRIVVIYKCFLLISYACLLNVDIALCQSKCLNSTINNSSFQNISAPEVHISKIIRSFLAAKSLNEAPREAPKNWTEEKNGMAVIPSSLELLRFECTADYRVQWGFQSYPWITWDTWTTVSRNESKIYGATIEFHKVSETSLQTRMPICYKADTPCLQTAVVAHSGRTPGTVEVVIEDKSKYGIDSVSEKEQFGINQNCSLKFGYDPDTQRFYCQETDPLKPKAVGKIFLRPCSDPVSCDSLLAQSNCTAEPLFPISECTIQNRCRNESTFAGKFPGIAVCHSGGLPLHSAAIPYFSSFSEFNSTLNKTNRYLNWNDADPSEMLELPSFDKPVYTREKLDLICNASYFYLGSGMYFTLAKLDTATPLILNTSEISNKRDLNQMLHKNGTFQETELSEAKESIKYEEANIGGFGGKLPVVRALELDDFVFSTTGTYQLTCKAPVWNETTWATKSIKFSVRESVPPEFDGGNDTVKQYYAPNKRLECMVFGIPKPELTWTRDGGTIPDEITLITGEQNQTLVWAILIFPKLEFGKYGNFTCRATNVAGTSHKSFIIIPTDKTSSVTLFILVGVGILMFVLIPLILFLLWKVRLQRRFIHDLTQDEIDEFINGKPDYIPFQCDMSTYAYYLPYNQSYEIQRESLEIDFEKILGSGEYGLVLYGLYKNANPPEGGAPVVKPVAVKTTKPLTNGKEYFKALLSELKIMTYIGEHENIVNLVGACTKNIKIREVYIATEFCENGSLISYLRMNRYAVENPTCYTELSHTSRLSSLVEETSFMNPITIIDDGKKRIAPDVHYVKVEDLSNFAINPQYENIRVIKQQDLHRWSYDIARGMEFLSAKKVIHGDLAARNVLLMKNLTAKICDFGLSRQLYHYNYYTKTAVTPLPLKWLAIECLQSFQFSIASDVWAYGVTLFEIFTIGEIPYSSIQMNGEEFLNALQHGMRLNKPTFASDDIFELMMKCWRHDKKRRPTFSDIVKFFEAPVEPNKVLPTNHAESIKPVIPARSATKRKASRSRPLSLPSSVGINSPSPQIFQRYANLPVTIEQDETGKLS